MAHSSRPESWIWNAAVQYLILEISAQSTTSLFHSWDQSHKFESDHKCVTPASCSINSNQLYKCSNEPSLQFMWIIIMLAVVNFEAKQNGGGWWLFDSYFSIFGFYFDNPNLDLYLEYFIVNIGSQSSFDSDWSSSFITNDDVVGMNNNYAIIKHTADQTFPFINPI